MTMLEALDAKEDALRTAGVTFVVSAMISAAFQWEGAPIVFLLFAAGTYCLALKTRFAHGGNPIPT